MLSIEIDSRTNSEIFITGMVMELPSGHLLQEESLLESTMMDQLLMGQDTKTTNLLKISSGQDTSELKLRKKLLL